MRWRALVAVLLLLVAGLTFLFSMPEENIAGSAGTSITRSTGPEINFTYLDHDGTGSFGSTAFRVWDDDLVIFIEAFPNSTTCDWDPETIKTADVIIQAPHGHNSHYDPNEVATVARNTGAYLVGNSQLNSDMTARGISSSKIYEVSPSLGGKATISIPALGLTVHSYGMVHTAMTGVQVNTFLIEMPSGIMWYHGTCSSGTATMNTMSNNPELKGLDVMICDVDMNFGTLETQFYPETLIKDHDYNSAPPIPATVYEDQPTVFTRLYHNQTYHYVRPDYKPELSSGNVDPDKGKTDTEFDFSILYKYRLDTAPTRAQVMIDDAAFDLSTTQTSYRTGVTYTYSTTLTEGPHSFHFEFEADGKISRFPINGEIGKPEVNFIPVLASNSLEPATGDDDMDYTFTVLYSDADGDFPAVYDIYVDDEKSSMASSGHDYINGATYTFTSRLPVGNHTYHFEFSDGKDVARLPEIGEFLGPDIERANYPPTLYSGTVEPIKGDRLDNFTFSVGYRDTHGDLPSKAQLVMDGAKFDMTTEGVNFKTGVKYTVGVELGLGDHGYHFEFEEGPFSVRFPQGEDEIDGPIVENLEPEADISYPSELMEFSTDLPIQLNGSSSTDRENDELTYTWTSNIDGALGEGIVIEVHLSEGFHLITLEVDDGFGGTSTDEVQIIVVEYKTVLDLEVTLVPVSPQEGSDARIEVLLTNIGNLVSGDVEVSLDMDGARVKTETLTSIGPGTKHTVKYGFKAGSGTHAVHVVVNGFKDEWFNFTISPRADPNADAGDDMQGMEGDLFTFDGTDSSSPGIIISFEWEIEGITFSGMVVKYSFNGTGSFNVTLTVTDDLGKTSTDVVMVTVFPFSDEGTGPKDNEGSNASTIVILIIVLGILLIIGLVVAGFLVLKKKGEQNPQEMQPAPMHQHPMVYPKPTQEETPPTGGTLPPTQGQIDRTTPDNFQK